MSDVELEKKLQKLSTGPRVTMEDFQNNIAFVNYFSAYDGAVHAGERVIPESLKLLTICVLTLKNGFTCIGTSACVSPENFNKEIGESIARKRAEEQIWPLMGYHLAQQQMIMEARSPDPELSESLTRLLAYSLGNNEALSKHNAEVIINHIKKD